MKIHYTSIVKLILTGIIISATVGAGIWLLPQPNEVAAESEKKARMETETDIPEEQAKLNDNLYIYKDVLDAYLDLYENGVQYNENSEIDKTNGTIDEVYSRNIDLVGGSDEMGIINYEGVIAHGYVALMKYAFMDFNQDGVDELIIGTCEPENQKKNYIFNIYTRENKELSEVLKSSRSGNDQITLAEDGSVLVYFDRSYNDHRILRYKMYRGGWLENLDTVVCVEREDRKDISIAKREPLFEGVVVEDEAAETSEAAMSYPSEEEYAELTEGYGEMTINFQSFEDYLQMQEAD